jgi:regulator of protease activity HflC (stomatin/prohibitin superfamily)
MAAAELNRTQERKAHTSNGGLMLLVTLLLLVALVWMVIELIRYENGLNGIAVLVLSLAFTLVLCGFYTLQPNEGAAITLFGNYKGTDRQPGLRWVLPWYSRKKVSLRVRNVTGEKLKVNDKRGNPIEIAAVVVWRVTDTAQALFDVDAYQSFVDIQIETAVREIASHFAYDHAEDEEPTLRTRRRSGVSAAA